jgi:hypothetical protein
MVSSRTAECGSTGAVEGIFRAGTHCVVYLLELRPAAMVSHRLESDRMHSTARRCEHPSDSTRAVRVLAYGAVISQQPGPVTPGWACVPEPVSVTTLNHDSRIVALTAAGSCLRTDAARLVCCCLEAQR